MNSNFAPWCIQRIETPKRFFEIGAVPDLVQYYRSGRSHWEMFKPSIEALKALIPLDYMGSAEFEFGAVGETLQKICEESESFKRVCFPLIGSPTVRFGTKTPKDVKEETVKVFGWVKPEHEDKLLDFCYDQLLDNPKAYLKERTYMREGLFGCCQKGGRYWTRMIAWLSLENGWFLSKDESQTKLLAYLLGINLQRS